MAVNLLRSISHERTKSHPDSDADSRGDVAPNGDAPAPSRSPKLGFSDVANLFVKLKRSHTRAVRKTSQPSTPPANGTTPTPASPPTTPRRRSPRSLSFHVPGSPKSPKSPKRSSTHPPAPLSPPLSPKESPLECSSGPAIITHQTVKDARSSQAQEHVAVTETFVCIGAVNAQMLIRATRTSVLEKAKEMGANVLVDERWKCAIRGQKGRPNGTFRVQITYTANATRASCADPNRPVALDQAQGVPGLMTIVKRNP